VPLDELVPADASEAQQGSGAQLASSLGLDVINNVCETRESLYHMTDDFRIQNARLAKPHSYKVGDSVLLSTKHVNLNLPCKKLSPAFVGSFSIRALLAANAVQLNYSELEVELDGSSWYQVEDILDHRGSPGPKCECLVRWKDFDVSHDSWIKSRFLTHLALAVYERFLTEHVRFCEGRDQQFVTVPKMYAQQLKSARERLITFTGNGRYSALKTSSSSRAPTTLISSETTFPITAASMTSDVAPNAPTEGKTVAPISTSSSGRVLRRPTHYKDTRR
jgi:hypothetical protein